jgi:N-acetylneuraminate epimerase
MTKTFALLLHALASWAVAAGEIAWTKLPPIPDREGFAGSFAGTHNGALIVAGGANFPSGKPWDGGAKTWHDTVFILEKPDGEWKRAGRLPRPLGYGVSITTKDGVVCIGGSDSQRHYADAFTVRWRNGQITPAPLPSLPRPCANFCGALVGNVIYLAGGMEKPDSTNAWNAFWSLDLTRINDGWKQGEVWPGAARIFAAAAAHEGSFYLIGGAALKRGPDGKPVREFLRDAFRFTPGIGWKRLADLPVASLGAPTPAFAFGSSHLFVLGGDDGAQLNTPPTEHRGFSRRVLAYDTDENFWALRGSLPFALVTTPAVEWNGRVIIPGGEIRPGVRSTEVWSGVLP